jgi:sulfite exporter TauE/SafE
MMALVGSVFLAALLGSVHCAAMCGSFACIAATGAGGAGTVRNGAAYHVGRLAAYVSLGLVAGAAGAGLDRASSVAGLARPAAVVAGVLLMLWGTATLLAASGVKVPSLAVPPRLASLVARGVRAAHRRPPVLRAAMIGVLTAALPCGWLYAVVVTSAAAGSAAGGAAVMAAFWLGTVPLLAAVGLGAQRLLGPARRRLPALTAALLVVIGALTAAGRFTGGAAHAAHAAHASQAAGSAHVRH